MQDQRLPTRWMARHESPGAPGRPCRKLYLCLLIIALSLLPLPVSAIDPPGCSSETSRDFSAGFSAADFSMVNVAASEGVLMLQTGAQAINPQQIVVPFEQEVKACFLYEDAGYTSTLGWLLKSDAVDADGNFRGWANIPAAAKHEIFKRVSDGTEGGDGVLDAVAGRTESQLLSAGYAVDGNGVAGPADMCKSLGRFSAGSELVFWLASNNGAWDNKDENGNSLTFNGDIFFTKTAWNADSYTDCTPSAGDSRWLDATTFYRTYRLGAANAGTNDCITMSKGFLDQNAIDRLSSVFGLTMAGDYNLSVTRNAPTPHVIVAAPVGTPNEWILSWEDKRGNDSSTDFDYNDITFRIVRQTGGAVQLADSAAVVPADSEAYYTAVTFAVYDEIPSGGTCAGSTSIDYFVSVDNGTNWVEVRNWDVVRYFTLETDGSKTPGETVAGWTQGSPERTYREVQIDFAANNLTGRQLLWKANLKSHAEACVPKIYGASLRGSTNSHAFLSRSSPVMVGNVLYSSSFETPAMGWSEKVLRGHIRASRLYDPVNPAVGNALALWDGGARLSAQTATSRNVYFPDVSVSVVADEALTLTRPDYVQVNGGDGVSTDFRGQLAHAPILATTLRIAAGACELRDEGTDLLRGDCGSGTINRFTGTFRVIFTTPPASAVPITAGYSWYSTSAVPRAFKARAPDNVSNAMLALDDSFINPDGYIYDFDNDGDPPSTDNSGTTGDRAWLVNWVRGCESWDGATCTERIWKLGAVDHSTPAVLTPPGIPDWYFGSGITSSERTSFTTFKNGLQTRQTVLFAGARDGMLHAFDAGKYRWGDNPDTPTVKENRGYFLWEGSPKVPNYGTGNELWAFIPVNLVARLKNNRLEADDRAYVDASAALADVRFDRADLLSSVCTARGGSYDSGTCRGAWSSVLLMAEGNGGDTVFCLDVTDPVNPLFLWEFADPELFRSRSSPAVGQIGLVRVDGASRWAAFFVSGKTYNNSLYPSIYVIDVANGSLIDRIFLDSDPAGIGGVPSGQPAIVDSDGNGYVDRIYVGTDKGLVYKVNLSDDPGTFWGSRSIVVINGDFIDEDGDEDAQGNLVASEVPAEQRWHPVYASPTVVVDNTYNVYGTISYKVRIFFGTGDSPYFDENINSANTTYHFFAYVDEAPKMSVDGVRASDPGQVRLDWFYALPAGQRVFASAFASAGKVYFGTSSSDTEDPCAGPNSGQTYVFDLSGAGSMQPTTVLNTGDVTSTPLISDKHLFVRTQNGMIMMGGGNFNNETKMGGLGQSQPRAWREIE